MSNIQRIQLLVVVSLVLLNSMPHWDILVYNSFCYASFINILYTVIIKHILE